VESAKARMGGNEELVADLARYFLEDAPKLVKDLERGMADGHAEVVERAAHSLKALAANFDAETLATLTLILEEHGRNGELEKVRDSHLLDLRSSLSAVSQELKEFIDSREQDA
jgi:HPt (histidine-containing phosphotransfer) domain-containing protein